MKLDSIQKTLPLLLLMTMGNWACSDNDPVEEVETETVPELSIEAEVHNTLLRNFYQSEIDEKELSDNPSLEEDSPIKYVPFAGIVLDESRPSVRSAEAETYDEARNDFMSRISDEEDAQTLITVSDKEVCVNLGNYGSVKFSASNEDGSLAKAEVSLADARPYTLYYKPHAAFPDNGQNNQNLSKIYTPGTVLRHIENRGHRDIVEYWLVVESSSYACYVIISYAEYDNPSSYVGYDHWKGSFPFIKNAPSKEQWESIRCSWRNNRDAFMEAFQQEGYGRFLYDIMERPLDDEDLYHNFVCVEGNDIGAHKVLWWAYPTWFSWAKRIKYSDLRQDIFNVEQVRYADGDKKPYIDAYYINYRRIERKDIDNYEIVYPIQ